MKELRALFPILNTTMCGRPLVYLDSAATMQMPQPVQERMAAFYQRENANIHRGIYGLSEGATAAYEEARRTAAQFIGAESAEEIVFTSGTTGSINLAAGMLEPLLADGAEILVTGMEHHSNLLPWMALARRKHLTLRVVPVNSDGTLDLRQFACAVNERTGIIALTEVSNVTGIRNPVAELVRVAREKSHAWVLVDGAQGVAHLRCPVRSMEPDFYCFSGHKLGAPTGTGVLYIRRDRQAQLCPCQFGGGTVSSVRYDDVAYKSGPARFEPGTPNYAGAIGLDACLRFWMEQDSRALAAHEQTLLSYLEQELSAMEGIHILGQGQRHYGCLSFVSDTVHPYDLCRLLSQCGVAVRSGHLCAQPYIEALGFEQVVRVSVAPYNTRQDVETFLRCLREILALGRYRREISDSRAASMEETEQDILADLSELDTPMEQYSFLVACAQDCLPMPDRYRVSRFQIEECQVNTWAYAGWMDGKSLFYGDSEALIVKGILALLQEIYFERSPAEVARYRCGLLHSELISRHLNSDQLAGLTAVMKRLEHIPS